MKQKDFTLIAVVAIISVIFAVIVSKVLINTPKNREATVEVVEPISPDFNTPEKDDKYFNANSIDPTQLVKIGVGTGNKQPFGN